MFTPLTISGHMVLVPVFGMQAPDLVCCSVKFKAPHVQLIDHPALRKWPPAVRLFKQGPWRSSLDHAAHNSFYQLARSILDDIASLKKLHVPAGSNKTELPFTLIGNLTGKGPENVLDIFYERLAEREVAGKFAEHVNALD